MKKIDRFYVLTDTHYVSKKNFTENSGFRSRERGDQIALTVGPEILRSFFDKIIADPLADAVLITGDLINNGDINSHEDFREELKVLTDAGKRVFVTTATHDYCGMGEDENFFKSIKYTENGTVPIPHIRKSELLPFYYDFGPKQSDSVHEESGSYSLKLFDGVRLIAINDNGNGRSHCGLFEDGVKWLENEIDKANLNGEKVLLAVHHPVIPPWDVYRHLVDFEMYGGYKELMRMMCDKGVKVIFTGHTHVQSIRKYTDEAGNWFYDVATTAAVSAKGKMRKVDISSDRKTCSISSVGIETIKGVDTGGKSAGEYIYGLNFIGLLDNSLPLLNKDFNAFIEGVDGLLPVDKLKAHPHLSKFALNRLQKLKLSTIAKLSKKYTGMSRKDIKNLGDKKVLPDLIEVVADVFGGNAPFTPDTPTYKVFTGFTKKIDKLNSRLHIKALNKIIPDGQTLTDVAEPMLYNNRTGDDDNLIFEL